METREIFNVDKNLTFQDVISALPEPDRDVLLKHHYNSLIRLSKLSFNKCDKIGLSERSSNWLALVIIKWSEEVEA